MMILTLIISVIAALQLIQSIFNISSYEGMLRKHRESDKKLDHIIVVTNSTLSDARKTIDLLKKEVDRLGGDSSRFRS